MITRSLARMKPNLLPLLGMLVLFAAGAALAQTPVDRDGNPIAGAEPVDPNAPVTDLPQRSTQELEELIGPIALYPDDLLAVVLPASTYPLEIVQAARFLEQREADPSLEPDESWDESVVALLNYPEVLRKMNDDIDWTWELGEAVVAQQNDVVAAIESFRDRAYAAGNLASDERQTVSRNDDDVIEIEPIEDDVIYVPYYEPQDVVVYQPRRVYHYYPRAYPVYYYPYPVGHHFLTDHFWGVSTAFTIGWTSNFLHVYHHSFHGHPYFGHHYHGSFWRSPSIYVFNTHYGRHGYRHRADRYRYGSYWRPRYRGGARPHVSVARSRFYSNRQTSRSRDGYADERRAGREDLARRHGDGVSFRERDRSQPADRAARRQAERRDGRDGNGRIGFRERGERVVDQRDLATRFGRSDPSGRTSTDRRSRIAGSSAAGERRATPPSQRRADPIADSRQRAQTLAERRRPETISRGQGRREPAARFSTTRPSTSTSTQRSSRSTFAPSSSRSSSATPRRSAPTQRATRPSTNRSSASSGNRRSSSASSNSRSSSASSNRSSRSVSRSRGSSNDGGPRRQRR